MMSTQSLTTLVELSRASGLKFFNYSITFFLKLNSFHFVSFISIMTVFVPFVRKTNKVKKKKKKNMTSGLGHVVLFTSSHPRHL